MIVRKTVQGWNGREWISIYMCNLPLGVHAIRMVEVHLHWICYKQEDKVSLILRRKDESSGPDSSPTN